MDEHDLAETFAAVHAQPAPPHGLSAPAILAAGRAARRRRRITVGSGSALVAAAAVALTLGLALPPVGTPAIPNPPANQPTASVIEPAPSPSATRTDDTITPIATTVSTTTSTVTPSGG